MEQKRKQGIRSTPFFLPYRKEGEQERPASVYRRPTKIAETFNDFPTNLTKTQPKFSFSIITHSANKLQVPLFDQSSPHKENNSYIAFLEQHKAFSKPVGMNTEYTDILVRNKALLRVKDSPKGAAKPESKMLKKKYKNSRRMKCFRLTEKSQTPSIIKLEEQTILERQKSFNKTISTHLSTFQGLLSKDRSLKSQWVSLSNSMNRMLAAQSISRSIYPRNR